MTFEKFFLWKDKLDTDSFCPNSYYQIKLRLALKGLSYVVIEFLRLLNKSLHSWDFINVCGPIRQQYFECFLTQTHVFKRQKANYGFYGKSLILSVLLKTTKYCKRKLSISWVQVLYTIDRYIMIRIVCIRYWV